VVTNFVAIERDITVRKSNELALLASENRFRQVVETIQEAFWIRDAEHGRVIYISPAYEKIWGFTCQSLYDSPTAWLEAVHPEDRERVQTEAAQQARGGYDETYRIIRPDGSLRWIHDKAFPVRDETGVVTRIVGVAEDITANQELEAQLRQAQKMEAIGTLAGGIAHDFNNILAAVNGYAELAKANSKGQPELLEDLEAVLEATCRATDLVRQIMAFSRRQNTQHGPVRLQTIVKEALRLLRATIPTTVEIKSVLKTNAPPILADATQIHQVVMNLCMNAWHAMKNRPGQLEIRVDQRVLDDEFVRVHPELKAGPHLQMSITDTGCGMNRETASRIFEPFFTTKGPNEGSGLGLAVVHGIVRSHHGAIIVRSEPNVGTTFDLYFPEYLGTEVSPLERPLGQAPQGRSEHVLFVDDDESLARLGAKVLKKFGYVVSAFSSSKEALAALRATPDDFDLVVSDLAMPEMSGLDLAREIRRLRPNLPIILTSGFVDQAVQEIIQTIGIQQVLPKPVRVETLIRTVHQVLAVESKA
jgi:PAS domain S-box-containing protein